MRTARPKERASHDIGALGQSPRSDARSDFLAVVPAILTRAVADGDCLIWTGASNSAGYGKIQRRKTFGVEYCHRIICDVFHGLRDDEHACHRCDTPSCVKPDHLFPATPAANVHDAIQKMRFVAPPTTNWRDRRKVRPHHWQRLTEDQISRIRSLKGAETQAKTAADFGVSYQHVSRIQKGERCAR